MYTEKPTHNKSALEQAIDDLLLAMQAIEGDSDEYSKMADQLVKLYKLKEIDAPKRISPDTLAIVLGNLAGIMFIVGYERANIVTSKALGFVLKLR
jgi:hypothetical protein